MMPKFKLHRIYKPGYHHVIKLWADFDGFSVFTDEVLIVHPKNLREMVTLLKETILERAARNN